MSSFRIGSMPLCITVNTEYENQEREHNNGIRLLAHIFRVFIIYVIHYVRSIKKVSCFVKKKIANE